MPLLIALFLVFSVASISAADGLSVIQTRCLQCHSEQTAMSELRLNSRAGALKGGTRGQALVPGKAAESLLYRAVTHDAEPHMPPTGKLADAEVAAVKIWIDAGAEWSSDAISEAEQGPTWWAFQGPEKPQVPKVAGVEHPIDAFIAAKLNEEGLEAAPAADRATLIRRAGFNLHGLPVGYDEVRAFENDDSPEAWKSLIDRLLDSDRYGEKWGRHWLDLVRYGDSGGFEQDPYLPEAWRFRDYVIKSFNDDKPYDRFIREQLAGDEIWPDEAEARSGTGYYRVNANRDMLFKVEDLNRTEKLNDYVDTTSKVFLGLSVACARCHDHKFDPIPQRDFYRMQAIFEPMIYDVVDFDYNSGRFYRLSANTREFKLRNITSRIKAIQRPYIKRLRREKLLTRPDGETALEAFNTPEAERTPEQQALFAETGDLARVSDEEVYAALSDEDRERMDAIEKQLVGLFKGYGPPPSAPGVIDMSGTAAPSYVAVRGNPEVRGEEVRPGYLSALGGGDIPDAPEHATTTYRRKHLAEWIASEKNPLTARVMVNRIWQYHFGEPIVETPSDFGTRATRVSHPELLDWLALEFIERGWSLKQMHRLIMTSETYRRSSVASPEATSKDPRNRYLSHFNRRRLDAEEIRDATLLSSGYLNLKMGGMPVVVPLESEELYGITGRPRDRWVVTWDPEEHKRRSVYLLRRRAFQQPMFHAFDAPDGMASADKRNESTTAPQALTLLNSRFMVERAEAFASKAADVEAAWQMAFARAPSEKERTMARAFLDKQTELKGSPEAARAELARSLLNSNEFLYVD